MGYKKTKTIDQICIFWAIIVFLFNITAAFAQTLSIEPKVIIKNSDPKEIVELIKLILSGEKDANSPSSRTSGRTSRTTGTRTNRVSQPQSTTARESEGVLGKPYRLNNISTSEMAKIIEPELSESGYLSIEENAKILLVIDKPENQSRITKIVQRFDMELWVTRPPSLQKIFDLKYIDPNKASEIINKANELMDEASLKFATIIPVPEKKWLIAKGTPENMKFVENLIAIIDQPEDVYVPGQSASTADVGIGKLNSGRLEEFLNLVFKDNSHISISAENSRSVLIKNARTSDIRKIQELIMLLSSSQNNNSNEQKNKPDEIGPPPNEYIINSSQNNGASSSTPASENNTQVIPRIIQLKNNSPNDLSQLISPILSKTGHISADENKHTLLVIDTPEKLNRIEKIAFDFDLAIGKNYTQKVFEFRHQDPIEAVQLVKLILAGNYTAAAQRSSTRTTSTRTSYGTSAEFSVPRTTTSKSADTQAITDLSSDTIIANGQPVIIIPYPDKKIIIARGPAEIIEEIQKLIAEPTEYKENGHDTFSTIHVDANEAAEKLNEILIKIGGDYAKKISIQPLTQSKQLLVFGDETYRQIAKNILGEIDKEKYDYPLEYEVFTIKYANVEEVADSINSIMDNWGTDYVHNISVYPLKPTSQIIVFGKKQYCDMIGKIIKEIDLPQNQLSSEIKDKNLVLRKYIHLKYESPQRIAQIIEPLLNDDAYLDTGDGQLVIIGKVNIIEKIEEIIKKFDVETNPQNSIQVFALKYMDPNIAAKVINKIIEFTESSEQNFVIPVPEKKWLITRTETQDKMAFIKNLLENIDFQVSNEGTTEMIDFTPASQSSLQLEQIIKPLLGTNGHIIAVEQAQTLVIADTKNNLTYLERLLKILDSIFIKSNDPYVDINLSNAGIEQIIGSLIAWTSKPVIPAREAMSLKINIKAPKKMRRSKALNLINTTLKTQGFIIEETFAVQITIDLFARHGPAIAIA